MLLQRIDLCAHSVHVYACFWIYNSQGCDSTTCVWLCSHRQVNPCGHGAAIRSTGWSHSGKHVLSSCDNGVVCIWTCQGTEPTLTLTSTPTSRMKQVAAFCWMDRMVMVGSGSSLNMYWYACQNNRMSLWFDTVGTIRVLDEIALLNQVFL